MSDNQTTGLVIDEGDATKKSFFDGNKRPSGKWMILMVSLIIIAALISFFSFINNNDDKSIGDGSRIAIAPKKEDVLVGGKATPEYNQAVINHTIDGAQKAESTGGSYMPTPINNTAAIDAALKVDKLPAALTPPSAQAQPSAVYDPQQIQLAKQAVKLSLENIAKGMELVPQETQSYIKTDLADQRAEAEYIANASVNQNTILNPSVDGSTVRYNTLRLPGGIHSGSIVYATNDLKLNSDGKNPVIRATILTGPLKNYVALGSFANGGETLALTFTRFVSPDGQEYKVEAYAIDPSISEANIASDVDHHYLSRWGGFAGAAFLNGFANATQMSGTTSTGINGLGGAGALNYGLTSVPTYSLMNKGAIGLGEVGRQIGQELRAGVNRPATVILDAGIPMGILVVSAGGSDTTDQGYQSAALYQNQQQANKNKAIAQQQAAIVR